MNRLYELISVLRKERGIKNDAELARLLGERQGLLSDLKSNESQELKFEKLRKIANFFGVPIDYFDEPGEPDPRDIPPEPELTDDQLLVAFWGKNPHKMTKDDLRRLKDLAKIMEMERAKSSNEGKGD